MKKTIVQRRIAVLNDVLMQLNLEKYIANNGLYISIPEYQHKCPIGKENKSSQNFLLEDNPKCNVCAKGAIFLSIIRKENKVKGKHLFDSFVREETNSKLFGYKNMENVEATFENWSEYTSEDKLTELSKKRIKFVNKFKDSNELLKGIIRNMIRNKGVLTFPKR